MSSLAKKTNVKFMAQVAILIAIEAIIAFVPMLGSIPIGPVVATIAHIPVIIATITLGLNGGLILGGTFGIFSLIVFSTTLLASPVAFMFTPLAATANANGNILSLVICFVPRLMIAVVTYYVFKFLSKFDKSKTYSYFVAGFLASLVHTVLVVGMSILFFPQANEFLMGLVTSMIVINGIPEAIIGGVLALLVGKTVHMVTKRSL